MTIKKFKKMVVPYALVITMLTGCSKSYKNSSIKDENTKDISSESSIIDTTNPSVSPYVQLEDAKIRAIESYNDNAKFYAENKLAYADEQSYGSINIDRVENMINLINGEVSSMSIGQIDDACEAIQTVLLPQELTTQLSNVHDEELGLIKINGQINLTECPSLIEYVSDSETKEVLTVYENLRDKVISELNKSNRVTSETKKELEEAVIQNEYDYLPDSNAMNGDVNAEGNKLLENYVKKNLIDLTVLVTNKSRIYDENVYLDGLKIAAETDEEKELRSNYLINGASLLTDEQILKYQKLLLELVDTKYIDGICAHQENLKIHASVTSDVYSSIDNEEKVLGLRI